MRLPLQSPSRLAIVHNTTQHQQLHAGPARTPVQAGPHAHLVHPLHRRPAGLVVPQVAVHQLHRLGEGLGLAARAAAVAVCLAAGRCSAGGGAAVPPRAHQRAHLFGDGRAEEQGERQKGKVDGLGQGVRGQGHGDS